MTLCAMSAPISSTYAQVPSSFENCTVSVLNSTAQVQVDGSYTIFNVPADQGFFRVRITCPEATATLQGQSAFFVPEANGTTFIGDITLGVIEPIPSSIAITASPTALNSVGATTQLTVTGTLPDGTTKDLTQESTGTTYTSSNPAIATVGQDGLVTAVSSGTAINSAINEGVLASIAITVVLANDDDGDGLPNDFEEANPCLDPAVPDAGSDPDADGLTNLEEFNTGSDPCVADTDGDGLNDGDEVTRGTSPTSPDSDLDGLLDGDEIAFGSDPLNPDSDGDGLPDGVEVALVGNPFGANTFADNDGDGLNNLDELALFTDPTNPDTDGDGISDGEEVVPGTDGVITDPLLADSDGDGISDSDEIALGTDPNVPDDSNALDVVVDGRTSVLDGAYSFRSLTIVNGGVVTHSGATTTAISELDLNITGTLTIDATSRIEMTGKGFLGGRSGANTGNTARTLGNTTAGGSAIRNGGSYGGIGAIGTSGGLNEVYGDVRDPNELGSGGGSDRGVGGNGGGLIRIVASEMVVDGQIVADGGTGTDCCAGGGSGGGIRLETGVLRGTGSIRANGGAGRSSSGGGGGGRIAIYYEDLTGFDRAGLAASGGTGNKNGGAGTIFLKAGTQAYGDLIINNSGFTTAGGSTPLRAVGAGFSTGLGANVLTDGSASFPLPDDAIGALGLRGLSVNPNLSQGQTFTIVDNTATTLITDAADGDMTTVATPGDAYIGVYTFDDLLVLNGANMVTADDCVVLGTLDTTGGSVSCNNSLILDLDGDGLLNGIEVALGTDLNNPDTDGDGLTDGEEVLAGDDPLVPEAISPTVAITDPLDGVTLVDGQTITVAVDATDNVAVTQVEISVNGALFTADATTPYELIFTVPAGVSSLTFSASATDIAGNVGTAIAVAVSVIPDPLTTVQGTVVDAASTPVTGAEVVIDLTAGLHAQFFDFATPLTTLPDLTGLTPDVTIVVSAINIRNPDQLFSNDPFGVGLAPDYAARFTGLLRITTPGSYTFILGADEGARLIVNGTTVVDLPTGTGEFQESTGTMTLSTGLIPVEVSYYESIGDAELQLSYIPPGGELQVVPPSVLLPDAQPFTATTDAFGAFSIPNVPTNLGDLQVRATFTPVGGAPLFGSAGPIPPVGGGITDVGQVQLTSFVSNGGFETGDLTGWTASGINGGLAFVVEEGTCFSSNNALGIMLNGSFAANVRSSGPAPTNSIGILTSDPFVAGSGIVFLALSENDDVIPASDPVTLEVRVTDKIGNVLISEIVKTSVVTLSLGCPGGELRDGTFSKHIINTSGLAGQTVRLEFRQHTNVLGKGFFTLVDDVETIS